MIVERTLGCLDEPRHLITDQMLDDMRRDAKHCVEVVVGPLGAITDEERREIEEELGHHVDSWIAVPFLGATKGAVLRPLPRKRPACTPRLMRTTRTGRATTARRGAAHRATRGSTSSDDGGSEPGPGCSTKPHGLSRPGRRANSLRVEVAQ